MRSTILLILLVCVVGATAVQAQVINHPLVALEGAYAARPGESTRDASFTKPADVGSVTDVLVHLSGTFVPGVTEDGSGTTYDWTAELVVFLESGPNLYWAVTMPEAGAFDVTMPFEDLMGSAAAGWDFLADGPATVSVALLASGDDGRTIVSHPSMDLDTAELELHGIVANHDVSWSDIKNQYR